MLSGESFDRVMLLIAFIVLFFSYWILLFILNSKFEAKYSRGVSRLGTGLSLFLIFCGVVFLSALPKSNIWLLFLVVGAILYLYLVVFRKGSLSLKLFWLFIILVFYVLVQTLGTTIALVAFNAPHTSSLPSWLQTLTAVFTTAMMAFTAFVLVRKGKKAAKMPPSVTFVLVLVPLLSCFVLLFWTDSAIIASETAGVPTEYQIVISFALALFNYAVFLLYDYMAEESERSLEQQALIQKAELSAVHYGELQSLYQETREWRHDYQNHLTVVNGLVATQRYEKLEEYVAGLIASAKKMHFRVSSGVDVIDAIINTKIARAEAENISFETTLTADLSKLRLTPVEQAALFGNLIDNALEACERIKDTSQPREIHLKISPVASQLLVYIKNSSEPSEIKKKQGVFLTSKKKGDHGIGMLRIDAIVEAYGGTIQRTDEGSSFETTILLPFE